MTLEPGDTAPDFRAKNQYDETVSPDFSDTTVVYFYPQDGTPGCTVEAEQFERESDAYDDAGVRVYGVSTDSVESHREFADEHGIGFDLLSDPDGDVAEKFGVDASNGYADRTTFVLSDGEVKQVHEGVDPDGHARDLMMDMVDDGLVELG